MITILIRGADKEKNSALASEIQALLNSLKIGVENNGMLKDHTESRHSSALNALRMAEVVLYAQETEREEDQVPKDDGILRPGDPVRLTNSFKWMLYKSGCHEHLELYGGRVGIITALVPEADGYVDVEWTGSTESQRYIRGALEPA